MSNKTEEVKEKILRISVSISEVSRLVKIDQRALPNMSSKVSRDVSENTISHLLSFQHLAMKAFSSLEVTCEGNGGGRIVWSTAQKFNMNFFKKKPKCRGGQEMVAGWRERAKPTHERTQSVTCDTFFQ